VFKEISSVKPGIYNIDGEVEIEVDSSSNITKWFLIRKNIDLQTTLSEIYKLDRQSGDVKILPDIFKKNILLFDLDKMGDYPIKIMPYADIQTNDIFKYRSDISRIGEMKPINSEYLNNKLITNELYSKGRYGDGWKGGEIKNKNGKTIGVEPDYPMKVGYMMRDSLTNLDTETYFIIEGVKRESNRTNIGIDSFSNEKNYSLFSVNLDYFEFLCERYLR
jgi:hypothetical protein